MIDRKYVNQLRDLRKLISSSLFLSSDKPCKVLKFSSCVENIKNLLHHKIK